MSSVQGHSFHSLISSYVTSLSVLCASFYSYWVISFPFLIELHQFSFLSSRLSLFYCFGSMKSLICFPSPFLTPLASFTFYSVLWSCYASSLLLSSTTSTLIANSEYRSSQQSASSVLMSFE